MGNCVVRDARVHWGGEEWDLSSSPPQILVATGSSRDNKTTTGHRDYYEAISSRKEEEADLLQKHHQEEDFTSSSSPSSYSYNNKPTTEKAVKEVKIKITKKQLEALLGEVHLEGLSIQQVLHQLMKASDHYETSVRSWRPNLKSIPE